MGDFHHLSVWMRNGKLFHRCFSKTCLICLASYHSFTEVVKDKTPNRRETIKHVFLLSVFQQSNQRGTSALIFLSMSKILRTQNWLCLFLLCCSYLNLSGCLSTQVSHQPLETWWMSRYRDITKYCFLSSQSDLNVILATRLLSHGLMRDLYFI